MHPAQRVQLLCMPRSIAVGAQLVLHTLTLKRAVRVRAVVDGVLDQGETATVRFEFLYAPEFVLRGAQLVFWSTLGGGAGAGSAAPEGAPDSTRAVGVGVAVRVHRHSAHSAHADSPPADAEVRSHCESDCAADDAI